MAYAAEGLRRLTYGGSISNGVGSVRSIFHYATNDTASTVEASNYFNTASAQFTKGDIIIASIDLDGTPESRSYMVTSATGAATVVIAASKATAIA